MNIELFMITLPVMIKGMLGIFIVTGVIILTIVLLNIFTNVTKESGNDESK